MKQTNTGYFVKHKLDILTKPLLPVIHIHGKRRSWQAAIELTLQYIHSLILILTLIVTLTPGVVKRSIVGAHCKYIMGPWTTVQLGLQALFM